MVEQIQQMSVPMQLIYRNEDLLHTFPKLNEALEVLFVLDGIKPIARQMVHEDDFHRIAHFCENHNVKYAVSGFKILKDRKLMVKPWVAEPGYHFVYFSLSQDDANKAKFYEELRNDEKLGEMLGYPKCCIKFYKDNYLKALRLGDEYSLMSIARTHLKKDEQGNFQYPSFLTNNMLRFFGVTLISHFPCSFDCVNSLFLAKRCFESVERRNKALAAYVQETLTGPVISHEQTGIHAIKGAHIQQGLSDKLYVKYTDAWLTSPNDLHDILSVSNKLEILNKNHIKIMKDHRVLEELQGDHIGVMVFE